MSVKRENLIIGTRGSALALTQTNLVKEALLHAHPTLQIEIVEIKTSGDWTPADGEVALKEEAGGKAQFAKEIEEALLSGRIDIAVHSMKDMDSHLPEGLVIDHMLPREDPRDCLLINKNAGLGTDIGTWPVGTIVGTVSVRRAAFLRAKNTHLNIVPLRGNVPTRIEKLKAGQVDVTMLACAGLNRLGLDHEATEILEPENMLPAAGQGAVGIERRAGDDDIAALLNPISCSKTVLTTKTERAVLKALGGSCHTPIAAYAVLEHDTIYIRAMTVAPDGSEKHFVEKRCATSDGIKFGYDLGQTLKTRTPPAWLERGS